MRILSSSALLLTALLAVPASAGAQTFEGSGQTATDPFYLAAGLQVFELTHDQDEGRFRVRLMDERGEVVAEPVDAAGRFDGSTAIRVPRDGRYVFDVAATGRWRIARRDPEATPAGEALAGRYRAGELAGREAAAEPRKAGWFARGLVAGALAGPVGAAIAVGMAGASTVEAAAAPTSGPPLDPGYADGFSAGFLEGVRAQRKGMVIAGGAVGTAVFLAAVVRLVDLVGGGSDAGDPPGSPSPPELGRSRN